MLEEPSLQNESLQSSGDPCDHRGDSGCRGNYSTAMASGGRRGVIAGGRDPDWSQPLIGLRYSTIWPSGRGGSTLSATAIRISVSVILLPVLSHKLLSIAESTCQC